MTKTKILIVDDRPENIFALSRLIEAEDVEIFGAQSADEALDLVVSHDFGLALMDVQMPNITGFQLARLIRGVKRCRNLPMIFLTAHQQEDAFVLEGYGTGAVDLLFKPLDPHVVRGKVRVFVQLDRQNKLVQEQMQELERLREEAEAANLAKSRFLANMSHEIRTPLSAVMGFAEVLIQEQHSNVDREECVGAIRRNGKLLLRLIDDILDLSKIEAQRLQMDHQPFDLQSVIRDVQSTLTLRAAEKGIRLSIQNESPQLPLLVGDALRVKQTLLNVIGNAVKFTTEGTVSVDVKSTIEPAPALTKIPAKHRIEFLIKDSGIGLSAEQARGLFQPFSQADASTRRSYGGTGLGLVISRQIARLMGGDLILKSSEPARGSEFILSFILQESERRSLPQTKNLEGTPPELTAFKNKRILIVDDVRDNRILIERILRASGAALELAANGAEAVAAVRTRAPHLILMDIQMPGMDGFEATRQIRGLGFDGPIVAVTAHAMKEEQDRCRSMGCDYVLTKPVNRSELLHTLNELLALQAPELV